MHFEAKPLRVQLPCRSLTVIDGEAYEHQIKVRDALREMFTPRLSSPDPCCAKATGEIDCIRGSQDLDLAGITDYVCAGTEPLDTRITVEASVLPALRRELEARLKEIQIAEEAVARAESLVSESGTA